MLRVLPPTFEAVLRQIRLQGCFVGGKTRNIANQIVLQQFAKQVARFFFFFCPFYCSLWGNV